MLLLDNDGINSIIKTPDATNNRTFALVNPGDDYPYSRVESHLFEWTINEIPLQLSFFHQREVNFKNCYMVFTCTVGMYPYRYFTKFSSGYSTISVFTCTVGILYCTYVQYCFRTRIILLFLLIDQFLLVLYKYVHYSTIVE